ncbi:protein of unknown function [Methylococcus capsulatus]|uniref:Spondin domain-containing protein n=1 Tax=Methylococcus capsulatus TaxID=414 RepID=A0AA35V594_METCP|nr:protein of unknown function [Methylococcus capsulatus]
MGPAPETFTGVLGESGRRGAVDLRQRSAELAVIHDGAPQTGPVPESVPGCLVPPERDHVVLSLLPQPPVELASA